MDENKNSKRLGFLACLVDAVFLGMIWLICCLPVFTIGPASTAFYYALVKSLRYGRGHALGNFFRAFRSNFKAAFPLWLICLAYICVWGLNIYSVELLSLSPSSFTALLSKLMILPLLLVLPWLFAYVSRFENTIFAGLKFVFLLSIQKLPRTLLLLLILGTGLFAAYRFPSLLLILPGLVCLVMSYVIEPVFRQITAGMQTAENADQWYND